MKILIIDIETTDVSHLKGKIVEIGIVELDLVLGQKKIIFNYVTHEKGITPDEVNNSWIVKNSDLNLQQIRFSVILDRLKPIVQNILNAYPLGATAFNNPFDFTWMESRGFVFPKKLPDPMRLSTDILKIPKQGGGFKWPNVEEAHKHFFGQTGYIEKHRGADDAFHEADIVFALYKMGVFKID